MWMELLMIYLYIFKDVQTEQMLTRCTSTNTCKYKGLCLYTETRGEYCAECYEQFYRYPEQNCVEIDFCSTANCEPASSVCLPVWGSFYCNCKPGYAGRQCTQNAPGFQIMSRPEVLFNPEPEYGKMFTVLVKFDGAKGSFINFNIRIDGKNFAEYNTNAGATNNLTKLVQHTDLVEVTPLRPRLHGGGSYILITTPVPEKPLWEIKVEMANGPYKQFDNIYTIKMVVPKFCIPNVYIIGCSFEKDNPTSIRRSNRLNIRGGVSPGCENTQSGSSELIIFYHLYRLTTEYQNPSDLNKIYSTRCEENSTSFTMPPFTLRYGLHALELHVDEIPARPTDKQKGSKESICYLSVNPKPIKTVIADGTEKTVGVQQVAVIDASGSVDENEPSETAMNYLIFSWSCSPPLPTSVIDLSTFTGDVLMIQPNKLKVGTYNFTVKVSVNLHNAPTVGQYPRRDIVPGASSAHQTVIVVSGKTALLSIVCVKNCGNPETINIQEIIYFKVNCLDLCEGSDVKGYYHWTANNNLHFDMNTTQYGDDTDRLIIKGNVIRPDITYTITVSASPPGFLTARAVTSLKANAPMVLADNKCTVTPPEGYSAKTKFSLVCDYPTKLHGFPLIYTIFQRTVYNDSKSEMLLSYLKSPNRTNLMLSPGDPNNGYKTYLTIQAQDENHLQYRKENVVSVVVYNLFEDSHTNLTKELPRIINSAAEFADVGNVPELLRLITSVMSSLDASTSNTTDEIKEQLKPAFVEYIDGIPLLSHREAAQALMALHCVLDVREGDNATSVQYETIEVASHALQKISDKLSGEVADKEDITRRDLKNTSLILKETSDVLMSNMKNSLKSFDAVSPLGVPPMEPADKEVGIDYSDYGDLDPEYLKNKNSFEKASMSIISALENMATAVGGSMAPGEKESVTQSPHMTSYIKVERPTLLADQLLGGDKEGVIIPKEVAAHIEKEADNVQIHVMVIDRNPFAWDPESRDINTKLLIVQVINCRTGKEIERYWKKKIQMFLRPVPVTDNGCVLCTGLENATSPNKVNGFVSVPVKSRKDVKVLNEEMKVYKVHARKGLKPLLLFEQPSKELKVAIGINLRPSVQDMKLHSQTLEHSVHVEGVAVSDHDRFYIAILPHDNALEDAAQMGVQTLTRSYSFLVLLIGCRSWNISRMRWVSQGCESGRNTTQEMLHCTSDHLSAFMGSIFVVPAVTDDYKDPEVVLIFGRSYIICKFVVIILLLSLLPLLFVCWLDRRPKTRYKAMLVILEDNVPGEDYAYLVGVYTGNVPDSASTCNVSLKIVGGKAMSRVYLLSDARRHYIWSRNSDNWFVVYTSSWLGDLCSITLWHDSWGHDPTWYCEKILIHDIQRNEVWVFLVQRYISVLYGDGTIFCNKEPATRKQITHKKLLFKDHWNICIREEHMWLSVFRRHPRSKYMRSERLAVCVCYMMLCMLISITMYGIPYKNPAEQIADFGSATETAREVMVILFTNIIVIPLMLPLLILFRKSRPKERKSSICDVDKDRKKEVSDTSCICLSCLEQDHSSTESSPDMSTRCRYHKARRAGPYADRKHKACYHRCQVCCHKHVPKHPGKCCTHPFPSRNSMRDQMPVPQAHHPKRTIPDVPQQLRVSGSIKVKVHSRSGRTFYCTTTFSGEKKLQQGIYADTGADIDSTLLSEPNFNKSFLSKIPKQVDAILTDDEANKGDLESEDEDEQIMLQQEYVPSERPISWAEYTKMKMSRVKYILLDVIMMDPLVIDGIWSKSEDKKKKEKEEAYWSTIPRYWFPHCMKYCAWLLCILMIALCALLVCRFGVQYGDIKSWRWIMMMCIILITSFIIWETLKVYLLALILARGYKVQAKHYQLHPNICWDRTEAIHKIKGKHALYKHVTKQSLEHMPLSNLKLLRDKQSTRRNLGHLTKDVAMYGIYIILQGVIAYIIINDMAYYSTKAVENVIIQPRFLLAVGNHSSFLHYMNKTFIPALHKIEDYNGVPFKREGITALYDTQLLGVAILRQVRVRKDACKVEPLLRDIFNRCRAEYSEKTADQSNYSISWQKFDPDTFRDVRGTTPWLYNEGYTEISGNLRNYPKSGYIIPLGRTLNNSLTILQFVKDYHWLDRYTRAVKVSFALYNANENLFNIVVLLVEMDHTGAVVPSYSVSTMTLLISYKHLGWFVLTIIVLWMLVLALFFMQKLIQVKTLSLKGYLKDFWNLVDLLIIGVAMTVVILALLRNIQVQHLMTVLEEKDHNEYVDFSRIALWQTSFIFLIGFLICVSTIRLWKVLRWNYIFRTCEDALFRGSQTLIALTAFTTVTLGSFSMFVYLYVGSSDYHYSSVGRAFSTLLLAAFGFHKAPVKQLTYKNWYLGGAMIVLYWLSYILFWLNLYVTVVMYYYIIARAYYAYLRIQYGMGSYLKEEIAYQLGHYDIEYRDEEYFANISEHVLQHPWDMDPIAISKPAPLRCTATLTITNTRLQIMRHIAKWYFSGTAFTNMRIISIGTVLKLQAPENYLPQELAILDKIPKVFVSQYGRSMAEESYLFYYGLENNMPKTIPDSKLKEMNTLVNYHYYHIFSALAAKEVDNAMNEILQKLDLLTADIK